MTSLARTATTRASRVAVRTGDAATWLVQAPPRLPCDFARSLPQAQHARTFASAAPRLARGGPIKVIPDFTWRTSFRSSPAAPSITLVTTDFDADALLETLTSKCVQPTRFVSTSSEDGAPLSLTVGASARARACPPPTDGSR